MMVCSCHSGSINGICTASAEVRNVVLIRMQKSVYCSLNLLTFNVSTFVLPIKYFKIMAKPYPEYVLIVGC